jgi:hypothetical protein
MFASPTAAYTDLDPVYVAIMLALIVGSLISAFGGVRWPALAVPLAIANFVLVTRLTPAECAKRLGRHQKRAFFDFAIASEGFVLRRDLSLWPVAAGTFERGPGGTTVRVRIGPFVAIPLFMVLVLMMVFSAVLGYGRVVACFLCSIAPPEQLLPPVILAGVTASLIVWVVSKGLLSEGVNELRTLVITELQGDGSV